VNRKFDAGAITYISKHPQSTHVLILAGSLRLTKLKRGKNWEPVANRASRYVDLFRSRLRSWDFLFKMSYAGLLGHNPVASSRILPPDTVYVHIDRSAEPKGPHWEQQMYLTHAIHIGVDRLLCNAAVNNSD
jgi:hypothetical protein